MKRALKLLLISISALTSASAFAATVADYPAGVAASGIANTRHNLGSFGRVLRVQNATTEICVFCHTPHHSNTSNGLRPMWNRGTSAPTSFTAYGPTIGGSVISNTDIGSTSLACLSCHDGVTTFDNIVNTPGKGGVTSGGANQNWRWQMGSQVSVIPGYDHFGANPGGISCDICHIATIGSEQAFRLNIGLDLSNDHPVSVAYSTDRAGLRPTNTTINSIDMTTELASSAASAYNGNLSQNRWAVKGFISDTATIADLLRDGKVECSSCHDPHFKNQT